MKYIKLKKEICSIWGEPMTITERDEQVEPRYCENCEAAFQPTTKTPMTLLNMIRLFLSSKVVNIKTLQDSEKAKDVAVAVDVASKGEAEVLALNNTLFEWLKTKAEKHAGELFFANQVQFHDAIVDLDLELEKAEKAAAKKEEEKPTDPPPPDGDKVVSES